MLCQKGLYPGLGLYHRNLIYGPLHDFDIAGSEHRREMVRARVPEKLLNLLVLMATPVIVGMCPRQFVHNIMAVHLTDVDRPPHRRQVLNSILEFSLVLGEGSRKPDGFLGDGTVYYVNLSEPLLKELLVGWLLIFDLFRKVVGRPAFKVQVFDPCRQPVLLLGVSAELEGSGEAVFCQAMLGRRREEGSNFDSLHVN